MVKANLKDKVGDSILPDKITKLQCDVDAMMNKQT